MLWFNLFLFITFVILLNAHPEHSSKPWVLHVPPVWRPENRTTLNNIKITDMHPDGKTQLLTHLGNVLDDRLVRVNSFTDGELVDAFEHFFWGKSGGIAIELGALDGTWRTYSQTEDMEEFGWKRLLIDGNPKYRNSMPRLSSSAYCVLGAICMTDDDDSKIVHYRSKDYVGGILEFMSHSFVEKFHNDVYMAGHPPGNLTSVDWDSQAIQNLAISPVHCVRLSTILHHAHVRHVHFFILDVEGGELEVLQSISWKHTTFDVLCIETEKTNRPEGYEEKITAFLKEKGYAHYVNRGRNSWYLREGFVPSLRPSAKPKCFNGARKSALSELNNKQRKNEKFIPCKELSENYGTDIHSV